MSATTESSTSASSPFQNPPASDVLCSLVKSLDSSCSTAEQAVTILSTRAQTWPKQQKEATSPIDKPEWAPFQTPEMIENYFSLLNTMTSEQMMQPFEAIFESLAILNRETRPFVDCTDEKDPNSNLYTATINLLNLKPNAFDITLTPALATLINKMQGPSSSPIKGRTDIIQLLFPFLLQEGFRQQATARRRSKMTPEEIEADKLKELAEAEAEKKQVEEICASENPEETLYAALVNEDKNKPPFSPSQQSIFTLFAAVKKQRVGQFEKFVDEALPKLLQLLDEHSSEGENSVLGAAIASAVGMISMMAVNYSEQDEDDEEVDDTPKAASATDSSSSSSARPPDHQQLCSEIFTREHTSSRMFKFFTSTSNPWGKQYSAATIAFLSAGKVLEPQYLSILDQLTEFVNVESMGFMPTILATAALMTLVTVPDNHPHLLTPTFLSRISAIFSHGTSADPTRLNFLLQMLFTLYRKASPSSQAVLRSALTPDLLKPFVRVLKDQISSPSTSSPLFGHSEPSLAEKAAALMQIMYLPQETAKLEEEARARMEEEMKKASETGELGGACSCAGGTIHHHCHCHHTQDNEHKHLEKQQ